MKKILSIFAIILCFALAYKCYFKQKFYISSLSRLDKKKSYIFLFLGDSITKGTGAAYSYSDLIEDFFIQNGYNVKCINLAKNGATSYKMLSITQKYISFYHPDVVFLSIGWNDLKNRIRISEYEKNLLKITYILKREKVRRIVFLSSTLVSLPIANLKIRKYNSVLKKIAIKYNFDFVDVYKYWQRNTHKLEDYLSYDGIHPNNNGQKLIFEVIKKSFLKKII